MANSGSRIRSATPQNSSAVGDSLLDDLSVVIVGNKVIPVSPPIDVEVNEIPGGDATEGWISNCDRARPITADNSKKHRNAEPALGNNPFARASSDEV